MNRPKAAIFDADGTLWDVQGIRHYVTPPHRNFHAFHMASIFCPPNPEVVAKVHEAVARGLTPLLVTARKEMYRQITLRWLERQRVPIDPAHVWMRPNWDPRKDYLVKRDILASIRRGFDPVEACDDNPEVVRLWTEEGIRCEVVPGWGLPLPSEEV
jgi:hypothetical protein